MGRKMKNIFFLILLLVLIYYQHSPALHAENKKEQENIEINENKENTEGDKEPEPEPEPVPEPVREYQIEISKADGRNGYYITPPEVEICHVSKSGNTIYSLSNGETEEIKGTLSQEGGRVRLSGEQFREGVNILTIHMEDENGIRLEEYAQTIEFLVDTAAPVFEVSAPSGFDVWYQDEVWIDVSAYDGEKGSQIESISCYCGNEIIGTIYEASGSFILQTASMNNEGIDVTVTVTDKAGHRSENTRKIYIDSSAPTIDIEGIRDYMITGSQTNVTFRIAEENKLKTFQAEIEWENADGEKSYLPEAVWTGGDNTKEACFTCAEDGIYRIKVYAEDMAGHAAKKESQIIIDSENPVIRYVDRLEGQYMKKFRWDYEKDEFIQDFTTYQYQIRVDEKLYSLGEEITDEGRHSLCVEAVDSAGNKSKAEAVFVIDHTPPDIIFSEIKGEEKYEEEKTFEITVSNPEDEIQEVRINGILQESGQNSKSERYTVREHGYYEVVANAVDKAGNKAVASITFEVVPKETIMQKVVKPIRRMLTGEKKEEKAERKIEEKKNDRTKKSPAGALAAMTGCSACAGGVFWFVKRNRKYTYNPNTSE